MKTAVALVLFLSLVVGGRAAEQRELVVDSMADMRHWQLAGQRVSYTLGGSSLSLSTEQKRPGFEQALRLSCDFSDPARGYVSAYWVGGSIPGHCTSISFWLYGDGSGHGLRVSLEDAAGRWYRQRLGAIDWEGWQEVVVPVGDCGDWEALRLMGEEPQAITHPVTLRQISVLRQPGASEQPVVYLQDLEAGATVRPVDMVTADIATGRTPALFYVSEAVPLLLSLRNGGDTPVAGRVSVTLEDFFGTQVELAARPVQLEPGGSRELDWSHKPTRLGPHSVRAVLTHEGQRREWRGRVAVSRPGQEVRPDHEATFGCNAAISGFRPEQMETVFRLNRDAGIRWARTAVRWAALEPQPGRFAWAPPATADGIRGAALECTGGGAPMEVPHDRVLDCRDALTLACWLKASGGNGHWQTLVGRSLEPSRRTYALFLGRDSGILSFTGGFEKVTDREHVDLASDWSAWDGAWHHVGVTYSATGKSMVFYVDGKAVKQHGIDGGSLRVGGTGLRFAHQYSGLLDEVVLYGRALAADEMSRLAAGASPSGVGLVGWWPFDDRDEPGSDRGPNALHAGQGEPAEITAIRRARLHGIRPLGIIGFPPRWASTAPADAARPWVHKPRLDALARFAEAAARQYRGLVDHWEIWNEPNIRTFWMPEPDPEEYIDVAKTAYAAAKRGNPDCVVVAPGLAGPGHGPASMAFLDRLIELGLPRYCDAISIHPYRHRTTPEDSDLEGDLRHIHELSAQHGGPRKLWITELCWVTHLPWGNTERRAAEMLGRAVPIALGTGLMDKILWFRFHDPGLDRFYLEHNCSLCRNDLLPKPEYFAYQTCARLLEGAEARGRKDLGARVWNRLFVREGNHVLALWSPKGPAMAAVNVGMDSVRVVDLMGNEGIHRTRGGILLVEADTTTRFLTGLAEAPEGHGPLLEVVVPECVAPGQAAPVRCVLRNPFPQAESVALTLQAWGDGEPVRCDLRAPPRGPVEVSLGLRVPEDARLGRTPVSIAVAFAGYQWTHEGSVAVSRVDPGSGPVGHWSLDEGVGTTAGDASGHASDGRLDGARWVQGKRGGALAFDGDAIVTIADCPALDLQEDVTLALWVKVAGSTGTWQSLVTKFRGDTSRNYGLYIRPDGSGPGFSASFERGSYRHTDVTGGVNLVDDTWHHLAVTVSHLAGIVRLYVDGKSVAERSLDLGLMVPNDEPLLIGQGLRGEVDDVQIHARALSAQEVAALAE